MRNKSEKLRGPAVEAKGPRRTYFEGRLPLFTLLFRRGSFSESKAGLGIESSLKHTTHAVLPTFGLGSEEAPSIPWITSDQVQAPSSRARCRRCFGCEGYLRRAQNFAPAPGRLAITPWTLRDPMDAEILPRLAEAVRPTTRRVCLARKPGSSWRSS